MSTRGGQGDTPEATHTWPWAPSTMARPCSQCITTHSVALQGGDQDSYHAANRGTPLGKLCQLLTSSPSPPSHARSSLRARSCRSLSQAQLAAGRNTSLEMEFLNVWYGSAGG